LTLKPNGTFTYTPDAGFTGRDSFGYHVTDSSGNIGNPGTVDLARNLVSFKSAAVSASEHSSAKLTVTLTHATSTPLTVNYQVAPETAQGGGVDFTLADGSITIPAGKKTQTLVVPLTNDTLYEGTETFQVWLLDPGGSVAIGKNPGVTVSIKDDDRPPAVSFRSASSSTAEGTTASIEVVLSAPSGLPVTINYAVDTRGTTATPGVDFNLPPGTITLAPGEASKFISLPTIDDGGSDPSSTVQVGLSKPSGAILKGIKKHVLTIDDP
jgi:hypothetical protein